MAETSFSIKRKRQIFIVGSTPISPNHSFLLETKGETNEENTLFYIYMYPVNETH